MQFAEYLRTQADWRREKSEHYADDYRNARSARALGWLAKHLEESEEVEPWVRETLDEGGVPPGEELRREVTRHGFNFPVTSAASRTKALEAMAVLAVIDAYQQVADGDQSGLLNPWELKAAREGAELERRYFELRRDMTEAEQKAWIDAARKERTLLEWELKHEGRGYQQDVDAHREALQGLVRDAVADGLTPESVALISGLPIANIVALVQASSRQGDKGG